MSENKEQFEKELSDETDRFIATTFNHPEGNNHFPVYHYTNIENLKLIICSQIFNASMIRNTSDPLEFALPLSSARDWLCVDRNLLSFPNFPNEFFKHFNELAIDPYPRLYFVSFSQNSDNQHLRKLYGDGIIRFESLITEEVDINTPGLWIKCKYVRNINDEVYGILNNWRDNVFLPLIKKFKIQSSVTNPNMMTSWLYIFMKLCSVLSFSIKQHAYLMEEEIRLVVFPNNPDKEEEKWRKVREFKCISSKSNLCREYLPIFLNKMRIRASENS